MIAVFDIGQSKTHAGFFTETGNMILSKTFPGRDHLFSVADEIHLFLNLQPCTSIILGIAGLSRLDEKWKSRFLSLAGAGNIPISDIHFYSDAALLGFQLPPDSLGVSIGTGSVLIKKEADESILLFGGWGYLFGDDLSGVWWFRETVRQAMKELEEKSSDSEVLDWLCRKREIIPERTVLIKSVYSAEREDQAKLGSESLSIFFNSSWMRKKMKEGIHSLFETVPHDFNHVCLQGGLLLSSDWLRSEIIQTLKGMNSTVSIETIDSLLPGGFQCWKSL